MNDILVNKLMVVAHPDDESLFGGGQLVLEGGWKVVCVTNGDNPIRRMEFESVMSITLSSYEIWNYYDERFTPLDEHLLKDLYRVVHEHKWDKIVTHNEYGDYMIEEGHIHHKQIHHLMKEIVGKNLWTFNFDGPHPLSDEIWQAKVDIVSIYESQKEVCEGHLHSLRNERITRGKILI